MDLGDGVKAPICRDPGSGIRAFRDARRPEPSLRVSVLRSFPMLISRRLLFVSLFVGFVSSASAQTATPALPLADLSRSLQELAARVSPSVVQIFVTGYPPPDEGD
jgi:hypothetical protein